MMDKAQRYYQALLKKDPNYDGVFYVGVRTTGVFCRPTCSARKPKFENCEFFVTAKEALTASFRPCARCQPLSHPNQVLPLVQKLVEAIEKNPEKRWKTADLRELSVDVSTANRQFKKRFGMTFIEYARARRMGIAMKQIREGSLAIDAQLASGYQSSSGFREAFSKIMGAPPSLSLNQAVLKTTWIDTPLGPMIAIADESALFLLEFADRCSLDREVERLRLKTNAAIIPGSTAITASIERELKDYFSGKKMIFKTPLCFLGSPFQKKVWHELQKIPSGETRSYAALARAIHHPKACRAVANANGANPLAIIVPCHRVINTGGKIGGYGGGIARKQWLLQHEERK